MPREWCEPEVRTVCGREGFYQNPGGCPVLCFDCPVTVIVPSATLALLPQLVIAHPYSEDRRSWGCLPQHPGPGPRQALVNMCAVSEGPLVGLSEHVCGVLGIGPEWW